MDKNYFETLNSINVNGKTEKKNGLTYLSWSWAWGEIKKLYPDTTYKVYENPTNGMPYFTDGKTAMVKVSVTCNSIEHVEWLPIMDHRNASIQLERITTFDVNKAIQRALTKAVARHGLGLYVYAGEDLPEEEKQETKPQAEPKQEAKMPTSDQIAKFSAELKKMGVTDEDFKKRFGKLYVEMNWQELVTSFRKLKN